MTLIDSESPGRKVKKNCPLDDQKMKNLVILGGNSHPDLVNKICRNLTIAPSEVSAGKFSNGETSVTIKDSVREKDVFVVQSGK